MQQVLADSRQGQKETGIWLIMRVSFSYIALHRPKDIQNPATSCMTFYSSRCSLGSLCIINLTNFIKFINFLNSSMESLTISNFSLKIMKDLDKASLPWVYCVFKWTDQVFCTRNFEIASKEWVQFIFNTFPLQMEVPKGHHLFRLQLWNYDTQEKVGQTNISCNDLTIGEKEKEFSINDRKIHLRFIYDRRTKVEETVSSEPNTVRISYNKSDPNLRLAVKPSSACIRKIQSPAQEFQLAPPKYDQSYYGKWKFIPTRHDGTNQKLRL